MNTYTKVSGWVPLNEVHGHCKNCKHNVACMAIQKHIAECVKQEYRFRCPIKVGATAQEIAEYEAKKERETENIDYMPNV